MKKYFLILSLAISMNIGIYEYSYAQSNNNDLFTINIPSKNGNKINIISLPLIYQADFLSKTIKKYNNQWIIEPKNLEIYKKMMTLKLNNIDNQTINRELESVQEYENLSFEQKNKILELLENINTPEKFINDVKNKIKSNDKIISLSQSNVGEKLNSTIKDSSISGKSLEENLIQGVSKFLLERTKTEISLSVIQEINDRLFINNDYKNEMITLFPNTYRYIKYNTENLKNNFFINSLKESVSQDLSELYFNTKEALIKKTVFNNNYDKESKFIINQTIKFMDLIKNDDEKKDILNYFININTTNIDNSSNFRSSLILFQTILKSLTVKIDDDYLIDDFILDELINSEDQSFITSYIVLLTAKLRNNDVKWNFGNGDIYLDKLLLKEENSNYLQNIFKRIKKVSDLRKEFLSTDNKMSNDQKIKIYQLYFNSTLDLIQDITDISTYLKYDINNPLIENEFKNIIKLNSSLRSSGNLVFNLYQSKYDSSFINISELIFNNFKDDKSKFYSEIVKYGNFSIKLVKAENTDQVNSAIEEFVLPPSSSRFKKNNLFTFEIGAYTGISTELNYDLWNKPLNTNLKPITAPIGLNIGSNLGSNFYFGIFPSILDFGAILEANLNGNETKTEFKLQNIVTPGLHLIIGIPKYPISFGVGGQYFPYEADEKRKLRFNAFIGIDIPLIRFGEK